MERVIDVVPSRVRFSLPSPGYGPKGAKVPPAQLTRNVMLRNVTQGQLCMEVEAPPGPFRVHKGVEQIGRKVQLAPQEVFSLQFALDSSYLRAGCEPLCTKFVVRIEMCRPLLVDVCGVPEGVPEEAVRKLMEAVEAPERANASGRSSVREQRQAPPPCVEAPPDALAAFLGESPAPAAQRRVGSCPRAGTSSPLGQIARSAAGRQRVRVDVEADSPPDTPRETKSLYYRAGDGGDDMDDRPPTPMPEGFAKVWQARPEGDDRGGASRKNVTCPANSAERPSSKGAQSAGGQSTEVSPAAPAPAATRGRPPRAGGRCPVPTEVQGSSPTSPEAMSSPSAPSSMATRDSLGGGRLKRTSRSLDASALSSNLGGTQAVSKALKGQTPPRLADGAFFLDGIGLCDAYGRPVSDGAPAATASEPSRTRRPGADGRAVGKAALGRSAASSTISMLDAAVHSGPGHLGRPGHSGPPPGVPGAREKARSRPPKLGTASSGSLRRARSVGPPLGSAFGAAAKLSVGEQEQNWALLCGI